MGFEKCQLDTFKNLPKVVAAYLALVDENQLDVKRNDDAWTIKEHLFHIVDNQEHLLERIKKVLTDPHPVIEPLDPVKDAVKSKKNRSVKQALAKYKRLRKEQFQLVKTASEADLAKPAEHKVFRAYSIPILVNHAIFHEFWHMYRIEQIWLTKDEFFK